jgi:hypothetical protein
MEKLKERDNTGSLVNNNEKQVNNNADYLPDRKKAKKSEKEDGASPLLFDF